MLTFATTPLAQSLQLSQSSGASGSELEEVEAAEGAISGGFSSPSFGLEKTNLAEGCVSSNDSDDIVRKEVSPVEDADL